MTNIKNNKIYKLTSAFFALLLSILMIGLTLIPASATESTGTITIQNVKKDETYSFYKIFDLTYQGTDADRTYNYRVNQNFDNFFGTLGLTGYSTTDGKITSAESKLAYDYVSSKTTPNQIADFATDLAKYAKSNNIAPAKEVTATSNDDITINNVESGYYVMTPSASSDVLMSALFSIKTVTDSVTITNKSVYPSLSKTIVEGNNNVDKNNAAYGNIVNYKLASSVPTSMNGYENYVFTITDVLDKDFTFNDDVVIKVGDKTLTKDTDYTVNNANNTITINFINFINYNTDTYRGKDIVVTYSATVENTADIGSVGNTNTAHLTYSCNPADTSETQDTLDVSVTTYIAGIQFTKKSADSSKALANAKFYITSTDGNITNALTNGNAQNTNKIDVTTDNTGVINITGLEAGTYKIEEYSAPNGYSSLDNPINITISFNEQTGEFSATSSSDEHISNLQMLNSGENNGIATFDILNESMAVLPNTGSMTAILIVALAVIAVVIIILLVSRKGTNKNAEFVTGPATKDEDVADEGKTNEE